MSSIDTGELVYDLLRFAFAGGLLLFLGLMVRVMLREIDLGTRDRFEAGTATRNAASLVIIDGGVSNLTPGQHLTFERRATIGRSPECDIQIDDPSVSTVHAALFHDGGQWYVEDFDSTNGTFAGARPVQGEAPIEDGDLVQFGRVRARLMC